MCEDLQLGDMEKAAAAATTFLVANPGHRYMTTNVQKYKEILEVDASQFIDLEAPMFEVSKSVVLFLMTNITVKLFQTGPL